MTTTVDTVLILLLCYTHSGRHVIHRIIMCKAATEFVCHIRKSAELSGGSFTPDSAPGRSSHPIPTFAPKLQMK